MFTGLGTGPGCKTGSGPNTNPGNSGGPNGVVIISNRGEDEDRSPTDFTSIANTGHIGVSGDDENRDRGQARAGDGNSTVKVIDLNTGHQVGSSIPTGGTCRADELWGDPKHTTTSGSQLGRQRRIRAGRLPKSTLLPSSGSPPSG